MHPYDPYDAYLKISGRFFSTPSSQTGATVLPDNETVGWLGTKAGFWAVL